MTLDSYKMINVNKVLKDFYLVCQPVVRVHHTLILDDVVDYEILIRSKVSERFPYKEFKLLTAHEDTNAKFLHWFEQKIIDILNDFNSYRFDINIDPQQLSFFSTWRFFKRMAPFHQNLAVEITEAIPLESKSTKMQNDLPTLYLHRLKKMGFTTVIDDIDSGQNTLKLVTDNLHNIDRIKLSLLAFKELDSSVLLSFLKSWHQLADCYHLELVIEGIDNIEDVAALVDNDFLIQQGFYWQKPEVITLNKS